jgi:hypothetical protein
MLLTESVNASTRDTLVEISLRGGVAAVALVLAPTSEGEHTLVVQVSGEPEPTLLVARPVGPDGPAGQPLELRPAAETVEMVGCVETVQAVSHRPADWLEDAQSTYDRFFSQPPAAETGTYHEGEALARELASAPGVRLRELAEIRNMPEFGPRAAALGVAVKPLARRGDVVALSEIVRVLSAIHAEDTARSTPSGAGAHAMEVLHAIVEPATLAPLAERILVDSAVPWEIACALFTWAQLPGAEALYSARLRVHASPARLRFVALMRAVGEHAGPVLQSALQQLLPEGERSITDAELAEDLLCSVPPAAGVGMGVLAARYAQLPETRLRAAGLAVLGCVGGERAIPYLRRGLSDPAEEVRLAAIGGLAALRAVDGSLVPELSVYLEPSSPASDDLRIAAAAALASVAPDGKAAATRQVFGALSRGEGLLDAVRGRRRGPAVLLAVARAAMSLRPDDAAPRIRARAAKCAEPLRGALLAVAASEP